ncbi:MAG: hypothetical protein IKD06_06445 [Clostridia bacterium]|nr:hypothetical protein [Clostridia bacterium]
MTKLFAKILSLTLALLMLAGCASTPATEPSTEPATIPFVPDVDLDDDGVLDGVWIRDNGNGTSFYKVREDYVGQPWSIYYEGLSEEEILSYPFVFKGVLKSKQKVASVSGAYGSVYWYCDFEVKEILACRSERKIDVNSVCKIGETVRVILNIINDSKTEKEDLIISETNIGDEMLLFCQILPMRNESYDLYSGENMKFTYSNMRSGLVLFKKDTILFSCSFTSLINESKGEYAKENRYAVRGALTQEKVLNFLKQAIDPAMNRVFVSDALWEDIDGDGISDRKLLSTFCGGEQIYSLRDDYPLPKDTGLSLYYSNEKDLLKATTFAFRGTLKSKALVQRVVPVSGGRHPIISYYWLCDFEIDGILLQSDFNPQKIGETLRVRLEYVSGSEHIGKGLQVGDEMLVFCRLSPGDVPQFWLKEDENMLSAQAWLFQGLIQIKKDGYVFNEVFSSLAKDDPNAQFDEETKMYVAKLSEEVFQSHIDRISSELTDLKNKAESE